MILCEFKFADAAHVATTRSWYHVHDSGVAAAAAEGGVVSEYMTPYHRSTIGTPTGNGG